MSDEAFIELQEQFIQHPKIRKYFLVLPVILEHLKLDPYEKSLLYHYWASPDAHESVRQTAEITCMSPAEVWRKRQALAERGLLSILDKDGKTVIMPTDVWEANFDWARAGNAMEATAFWEMARGGNIPIIQPRKTKPKPAGDKVVGIREMQSALLFVTGRDKAIAQNWVIVSKTAKELITAGYNPQQVIKAFGPSHDSWWASDWRGKNGDRPQLSHIITLIKQANESMTQRQAGRVENTGVMEVIMPAIYSTPSDPD